MKSQFNPEDLGLVNINETGMNFYIVAKNDYNYNNKILLLTIKQVAKLNIKKEVSFS